LAIEKARAKLPPGLPCRFAIFDFLAEKPEGGPFQLIFDRGCFHVFDGPADRAKLASQVAAVLAPGGMWLSLIGSTEGPPREVGPPRRSLRNVADAIEQRKQIQNTQSQVGYPNSLPPEAVRQIQDLRNQLATAMKERDEARQREHKPDENAAKLQADLDTARGVIATLQKQLEDARATRPFTTVFPCSDPEVFFLAKDAIRNVKVDNEDIYLFSANENLAFAFMSPKQWWSTDAGRFANDTEANLSQYLTETKGSLEPGTFRQLSFGTQSLPLRSGWRLNITVRGARAPGTTIRLCADRAPSGK